MPPSQASEIAARISGMEFTDEVHWVWCSRDGACTHLDGKSKHWIVARSKGRTLRRSPAGGARCYEVWISGKSSTPLRTRLPEEGILQKPQKRP